MYRFELWFDGQCLHEDDDVFESEMEAMEEGIESAIERINLWKMEDAWHGETVDDFDIRIKEVAA